MKKSTDIREYIKTLEDKADKLIENANELTYFLSETGIKRSNENVKIFEETDNSGETKIAAYIELKKPINTDKDINKVRDEIILNINKMIESNKLENISEPVIIKKARSANDKTFNDSHCIGLFADARGEEVFLAVYPDAEKGAQRIMITNKKLFNLGAGFNRKSLCKSSVVKKFKP